MKERLYLYRTLIGIYQLILSNLLVTENLWKSDYIQESE